MYISELSPRYDSRKSFYGKAHLIHLDNGTTQLQSYDTVVCEIDKAGNFKMLWDGKTQTTSRHIKEFKRQFNVL